ncbi:MAG: putative bifunctional diguanylate cyclase/phosphodiesterase, partial [Nitrospiria bacterium]
MKPVPLRILIVEHSEADARLLIETLRRGGFEPYFQCVDTETALRLALGSHRTESSAQHWDLVMANIHTPDIGALKVLEVIRESGLQVPLIAVSERADIKAALLCTQEGAYDFIRKDDSSRLFGVVARVLREAGVHGARERSAAVLAAKDQYLAMIFDTADEGIVSVDADQRICYFNKGAEETFGYTAEEVLGRPLDILIPEGVRSIHSQHMRGFVESGEVSRKKDRRPEIRGLRKNGEIFDAEGSISKVVTPDGVLLTAILRDITSRKQAEARLHHLAYFDPLSELPNRTLFMERLEHAVIRRRDAKNNLAVLMLDLDRFKTINDSLGHKIGDQLVQELSSRLLACVRREDTVARIGGDEFAVLLESVGGSRSVFTIANKIMGSVSEPFLIKGHELFVTLSIGFSLFPKCAETAVALVQFADTALYRAKDKGRNCIEYYDKDISPKAQRKLSFENKLRRALDRDEFVLYYQPQVSLENGRMIGAEALIRWKCPGLGRVGGEDFVPLLEETGLILPVGEWVMRTAFEQIRVWQDEGLHLHVSVNLSAKQFARRDLPKK